MRAALNDSVLSLIGNTPLVKLRRVVTDGMATIYAKAEQTNPGGSVKDRICLSMIEQAERDGALRPGSIVVEPTSGNTGVGLALVCSVKGYKLRLAMPEGYSLERQKLLEAYGAEIVLTPAHMGMRGAIERAEQIVRAEGERAFAPAQFRNDANPEAHRRTTGPEILRDLGATAVDAFVTGVGTGGTITGVGEVLKGARPQTQLVAVEPATSAVLSGKPAGAHRIQGIGAGFVPPVCNRGLIDRVVTVGDEDAWNTMRRLATEEGLLVGISAGANVFAAMQLARELGPKATVVTMLCDTGERYFSLYGFFDRAFVR